LSDISFKTSLVFCLVDLVGSSGITAFSFSVNLLGLRSGVGFLALPTSLKLELFSSTQGLPLALPLASARSSSSLIF
jgi:hypothetical protein